MMRLGHGQTSLTATLDLSSVFDEDAEETFDGTDSRTVEHHRNVFLVVLADIFRTETLRQVEVHLNRSALPVTTERILQSELQFRAIESTFARI